MSARFSNLPHLKAEELTIVTSGTPVQGSDIQVPSGIEVVVLAHPDNTGRVSIASSSAAALTSATTSMLLDAGQSVSILIKNTQNIWADSTVDGDKVRLFMEFGG